MIDTSISDLLLANGPGESFCFAPFVQMLLSPAGVVHPCCWHFGKKLGDMRKETISEIWNGDRMQKLRREFLSGEIKTCRSRIMQIGCNRQFDRFHDVDCQTVMVEPPRRLDVRLNGQCNLQCTMCDVWKQPNRVYDGTSFWTEGPADIFPHLLEIDMLGGEPFIQRDTYRLIESVRLLNPGCRWSFVTNGQYQFGLRVRRALDGIEIREFQISLDSLDAETYRAIRVNGELAVVLDTVEQLVSYQAERTANNRGFRVKLSMCVLQSNWQEISTFIDFCKSRNVSPELQFAYYDAGSKMSLELLSEDEKIKIVESLTSSVSVEDRILLAPIIVPLMLSFDRQKSKKIEV